MTPPAPHSLVFCLGGRDLEMETIAALVRDTLGPNHVIDRRPGWGATADLYAGDIATIRATGRVPVLVELPPGAEPLPEGCLIVDHHGPLAGADRPTSLEQVFALLRLPPQKWTRFLALVAANDRGHVAEMRSLGASVEEMTAIRAADRRAQGVTDEEERSAATALSVAERRAGGRLLVVRLPHGRTAPVMDRLALEPAAWTDEAAMQGAVVLISPGEVNAYGPGPFITALDDAFPGGWSGGALPQQGFWGTANPPAEDALLSLAEEAVAPPPLGRMECR